MSIEKEYGKHIIVCDICEENDTGIKYDTWDDAKAAQDSVLKCGNWYDICPGCENRSDIWGCDEND